MTEHMGFWILLACLLVLDAAGLVITAAIIYKLIIDDWRKVGDK